MDHDTIILDSRDVESENSGSNDCLIIDEVLNDDSAIIIHVYEHEAAEQDNSSLEILQQASKIMDIIEGMLERFNNINSSSSKLNDNDIVTLEAILLSLQQKQQTMTAFEAILDDPLIHHSTHRTFFLKQKHSMI